MKIPSWKEAGIPNSVVEQIQNLKPGWALDTLVYQIVFHNKKRLYVTYSCDLCGHNHTPNRATDEISQCPECFSKCVHCVQSLKFGKGSKLPPYSRQGNYLNTITYQMSDNFRIYFNAQPEKPIDWEWHDDLYHVAFAGGETATGQFPRIAVSKAALLTPYLWDSSFDWANNVKFDKMDTNFITSLLSHLQPPRKKSNG